MTSSSRSTTQVQRPLRIVIGIATTGRREQLKLTLEQLRHQVRPADAVVICPAHEQDVDAAHLLTLPFQCEVVRGPKGLPAQRNRILEACKHQDVVAFFDDDYYPDERFIAQTETLFNAHPDIVAATGRVIADGNTNAGVAHADALNHLASDQTKRPDQDTLTEVFNCYGCNMLVRLAPAFANGLQFDENLPLYGWLEDVEFCGRLRRHGRIVRSELLRGVHLATKAGRTSGVRFGYSQIANPVYMMGKGSMPHAMGLKQIARNVGMNCWRSVSPEPWVDRRGRLKGNLLGLLDLVRRQLHPTRILKI